MSDGSADTDTFQLTDDNRGIGAAASIIIFARSTGRNAKSLSERHFEEYRAWIEQHPEETDLTLQVHFKGTFTKLIEHVDEVTEPQLTTYKKHVGLN